MIDRKYDLKKASRTLREEKENSPEGVGTLGRVCEEDERGEIRAM